MAATRIKEDKRERVGRDFWREEGSKEWNQEECFPCYKNFQVSFFSIGISIFSPILLLSFFLTPLLFSFIQIVDLCYKFIIRFSVLLFFYSKTM